jgi:hypothetical protein
MVMKTFYSKNNIKKGGLKRVKTSLKVMKYFFRWDWCAARASSSSLLGYAFGFQHESQHEHCYCRNDL